METTNNMFGPSIYRNIHFFLYFIIVHAILFCNFFLLTYVISSHMKVKSDHFNLILFIYTFSTLHLISYNLILLYPPSQPCAFIYQVNRICTFHTGPVFLLFSSRDHVDLPCGIPFLGPSQCLST